MLNVRRDHGDAIGSLSSRGLDGEKRNALSVPEVLRSLSPVPH